MVVLNVVDMVQVVFILYIVFRLDENNNRRFRIWSQLFVVMIQVVVIVRIYGLGYGYRLGCVYG